MVRNKELKLLLDKDEKKRLEAEADKLGLKLSQYIRMVSLNAKIKVEKE